LYCSPNIIRMIKLRLKAWKRREMHTKFWNLNGRSNNQQIPLLLWNWTTIISSGPCTEPE
jgi:hypothetical protein